jgi:hypothetical protein
MKNKVERVMEKNRRMKKLDKRRKLIVEANEKLGLKKGEKPLRRPSKRGK